MPTLGQFNFDAGEWAEEYWGRADLEKYHAALKRCRNMVVLPAGSATRRPGYRYVANAGAGATVPVVMHRFRPSSATVYMLEFGPAYIRFFRKRAPVMSGMSPFQVTTTYAAADLKGLSFAQNLNQLFIFSQKYSTRVLTWDASGDTGFSLALHQFDDGPYIDPVPGITATPAAAAASTTVEFSGTGGINGGQGFLANNDVGRLIRFKQKSLQAQGYTGFSSAGSHYQDGDTITLAGGTYVRPGILAVTAIASPTTGVPVAGDITDPGQYVAVPGGFTQLQTSGQGTGHVPLITTGANTVNDLVIWGTITAVNSTTNISVTISALIYDAEGNAIDGQFVTTAAIEAGDWRLGAFCPYEGFPAAGFFFQHRLIVGGTVKQPKRWWGSDLTLPATPFINFMPTLGTLQAIASNGLDFTENDDEADPINWFADCGKEQIPQFAIGTGDSEFVVQPSPAGGALTATGVSTYRDTRYGNAPVAPLRIGRALLFADRSRQRLRSWVYQWGAGGFIGAEANPNGRHLLLPGIAAMDYALTPHPVLWLAMQDGSLAAITYQLDEGPLAAWHSHQLGGSYYGGPPLVASLAVAPSEDATPYDEVWVAVQRADAAGGVTQTIEVSTSYFRDMPLDQAVFLDCAVSTVLTFPAAACVPQWGPFAPSGNTLLPARGDTVGFHFGGAVASAGDDASGVILRLGGGNFRVASVTSPTVITAVCLDPPQHLAPAATTEWSYTAMHTSFSGFAALAGRSATVIADGQVQGPFTVPGSGVITLPIKASFITAGLAYDSELETLDLDLPSPDGTTQGKTGRLDHLYLRLFQTCGGSYGRGADEDGDPGVIDDIEARRAGDLMNWAPPPRSEDLRVAMPGGSTASRSVIVRQSNPWPLTVTALVVKGLTTEKAAP